MFAFKMPEAACELELSMQHVQVKALWMWLQSSGAKLATIGTIGPLPGTKITMDPDVPEGHGLEYQSAGFVVISKPGTSIAMWK